MQISKKSIAVKLDKELNQSLIQLITDLRSPEDTASVLDELFSPTERVAIVKRIGIAVLLEKGWSYDKIRETLKVSSATIANIQERMGSRGLKIAIEMIKVNVMADSLADKLSKLFSFRRIKS